MKISFLSKGVLIAAALCLAPAALPASPKPAGQGVVAVNPQASPGDTASLLEQVRVEALSIKNNADQLQMLLRESTQDFWEGDAALLEDVRDQVNKLNKLVYDVRVHQAEASPLQQEVIARVTPSVIELVGTTQDALTTLNNNQSRVYMSDLPNLANDIYTEASRVAQTVRDFDKYVHSRQEEQQLKQTLGL